MLLVDKYQQKIINIIVQEWGHILYLYTFIIYDSAT